MLIKKFQAVSMPEALKLVKAEFGLEAMILNSREECPKGIMRFFRKPFVEVTAAMSPPSAVRPAPEPFVEESRVNTREEFRNSMLEPLAREIRMLKEKVETLFDNELRGEKSNLPLLEEIPQEPEPSPGPAFDDAARPAPFERLLMQAGEMTELQQAREPDTTLTQGRKKGGGGDSRPELSAFAEELRQNGVETDVATTLMERILPIIGRKRKADALRKGLRQALESLAEFASEEKSGDRRIIALVGPAGVGKTATIAKIAATAAEQGKSVAVVTSDALKPDAAKQLKQYAGSAEIVVNTATTPQKLIKAMETNRGKDIILVDTAGVSPNDNAAMEQLQELLAACPGIEKHLCLSSTTRDRELDETVRRFERYAIDKLIFTRLDESLTFGSIINVLLRNKLPLSFLASGQRVLGDLELATADRLSELAIGGKLS
jgi:flagellar biosynthesis protein FlhF